MRTSVFVFTEDLAFFLPRHEKEVQLTFEDHQSIKHLVESLGVPQVEVGKILQDGLTLDSTADAAWAISSAEVYTLLVSD
jgi:hypothetical protein